MSLLTNPAELSKNVLLKGLIYGQPGTGKTTLALSAPNPVLIDVDRGLHRVKPRYRVPSLQAETYEQVLELVNGSEVRPFDTIVFDTLGKLIDIMAVYVARKSDKNRRSDGQLSMQGFGALKGEFQSLMRLVNSYNKHVIFVAHEREEKDGENTKVRPDVMGSSGKDIVKDLDFMGYVQMVGDKRTIHFVPQEKFYAKSINGLPGSIPLPDPDKEGNTFIKATIIDGKKTVLEEEANLMSQYAEQIAELDKTLDTIKTPKDAGEILEKLKSTEGVWDYQTQAQVKFRAKVKDLGFTYDKEKSCFVSAKLQEAREVLAAAEAAVIPQAEAVPSHAA